MTVRSAGILLFRRAPGVQVLLGHMGGPFWSRKHEGAWSIPKGEVGPDEDPWAAARREFGEELGVAPPSGPRIPLGEVRQSRKLVTAWAVEGDLDPATIVPGVFEMEWPPRSGTRQRFPEVDRVEWFDLDAAFEVIVAGQRALVDRLRAHLD